MSRSCINEMNISFLSKSANEGFARVAVGAFAARLDPTVEQLADIKTAVSEAVTNCIVHAYRDSIGIVYINAKIFDNGTVSLKIRDRGCGIENIQKAMEPLYTSAPDEERAGLGFAVMQAFMDKVRVSSRIGRGTTVTMEKLIKAKGV